MTLDYTKLLSLKNWMSLGGMHGLTAVMIDSIGAQQAAAHRFVTVVLCHDYPAAIMEHGTSIAWAELLHPWGDTSRESTSLRPGLLSSLANAATGGSMRRREMQLTEQMPTH